jgi:hypothetical protein
MMEQQLRLRDYTKPERPPWSIAIGLKNDLYS